jgi:hypothetical protein
MQTLATARNRQYMRDELREILGFVRHRSPVDRKRGAGMLPLIFEGLSLWH